MSGTATGQSIKENWDTELWQIEEGKFYTSRKIEFKPTGDSEPSLYIWQR
ncbi:hypothetical protein Ngar_c09730 [Candidatus Nitrososphaera gargensis Ga9.2]|uniref:Uncharacterized protein n=1 Tax=Nitrososphaera gargensis (strain Ga9.2) TaxID=1237085 RepID=K0IDV0_NITGG|nr:hypothetical protein Ngar_c09730 [Candidatus Nitrososphaera gargensis Ga9.2]